MFDKLLMYIMFPFKHPSVYIIYELSKVYSNTANKRRNLKIRVIKVIILPNLVTMNKIYLLYAVKFINSYELFTQLLRSNLLNVKEQNLRAYCFHI